MISIQQTSNKRYHFLYVEAGRKDSAFIKTARRLLRTVLIAELFDLHLSGEENSASAHIRQPIGRERIDELFFIIHIGPKTLADCNAGKHLFADRNCQFTLSAVIPNSNGFPVFYVPAYSILCMNKKLWRFFQFYMFFIIRKCRILKIMIRSRDK